MGQLQIDSFYASQTAGSPLYKISLLQVEKQDLKGRETFIKISLLNLEKRYFNKKEGKPLNIAYQFG